MLAAVHPRVAELKEPREPKAPIPLYVYVEAYVACPSLFDQGRHTQYRGTLNATAVASAGALHDARRDQSSAHFIIKKPSSLSKCFTLVHHTMPDGQTMILKDTSEKHTTISKPADHKAKSSSAASMSTDAENGLDFESSAFERSDKSIAYIVQRVLPNIPHLLSVPTKTPYMREFPNENQNTPFEDWEVQNLQHMTLVSNGSRGVAWARGDWQEEYNAASPHSGFRSGTATPRSEKGTNRIRTKMSLADYKANANRKPTGAPQPPRISGSQSIPNGQSTTSKNPDSPTQQLIDKIIENNLNAAGNSAGNHAVEHKPSKLVPRFSDDHPVDIVRPPQPDPPYVSDAPHPSPLPKPQRQAEEGRVVWPPSNKPDWKQTQNHNGSSEPRAKPKKSDHAVLPSHPEHPSNQQKSQKTEEKQTLKKGPLKQPPANYVKAPTSKRARDSETVLASTGKVESMPQQLSGAQKIPEKKPETSIETPIPPKPSASSKKGSQKEAVEKPLSIDLSIPDSINSMPPLLSPLPVGLLSPDHPGLDSDTAPQSSKSDQITPPSSEETKVISAGPVEQTQHDLASPLESPFEMPPKLPPLPQWWMEKVSTEGEVLRLYDHEMLATAPATLGARRERSRQPDTPGVARKTTKAGKAKSGLAKDVVTADSVSSTPAKASENVDNVPKKPNSKGADRDTLMVKLKYGKRNSKAIIRLLQMTARSVPESKNISTPAHASAGTESRKHARLRGDSEEPSTKRSKTGKSDPAPSIPSGNDAKKRARQPEDSEEPSTKRSKVSKMDDSTPTSSGLETKKHARPLDDTEDHSAKRPKVAGNVDIQRARTPLTPSASSPAPSTSQKAFSTPKKGDAMKSVAMRRVDSNDGQVLTPHGGSGSTPASTEKSRSSGGDAKSTEIDALKATHAKYTAIGTTLKRQADQVLKVKEKDHGPVSDKDKRLGAVIAIESALAYMIAFDSMDRSRHKERKAGHAEQWSQFLPFMVFATERAKGHGTLFTLALILNAVSRECLERIYMERLGADTTGTLPSYLKELAKNSQLRQSAWSAYREQCHDHPVPFVLSVEEAKSVAMTVLSDFCKTTDIAWETKLEF